MTDAAWMNVDYDVAVIGAGPVGLATAAACQQRGLRAVTVDRGPLCASIVGYPTFATFFSTAERLAIAGIPFVSHGPKPTRREALTYYRLVAEHLGLDLWLYTDVTDIDGQAGAFTVRTSRGKLTCRDVVLATGYFGDPVRLDCPGEDQAKVTHYYRESHPYSFTDLLIVGGRNSAVEAALDCYRSSARVTMCALEDRFQGAHLKYWLLPNIQNRIDEGAITMHWRTTVERIEARQVVLRHLDGGTTTIANDFVLALTGYRPDFSWLQRLGITLGDERRPVVDDDLQATARPGVYLAGTVLCGDRTDTIFIENGRDHAARIADALARSP